MSPGRQYGERRWPTVRPAAYASQESACLTTKGDDIEFTIVEVFGADTRMGVAPSGVDRQAWVSLAGAWGVQVAPGAYGSALELFADVFTGAPFTR